MEDQLGDEEVPVDGERPADQSLGGGSGSGSGSDSGSGRTAVNFTPTDKPQGGKGRPLRKRLYCVAEREGCCRGKRRSTFNLANCAEHNNRPDEATRASAPLSGTIAKALDAARITQRIAELETLRALPNQTGSQVRWLYASANRSTEERQYDRALADFTKATDLAPDFALTRWKLGLLQAAFGNVAEARKQYTRYRELDTDTEAQGRADFHLGILDAKKETYDAEISDAEDAISDLLNRGMNLTFNGLENRSAVRAHRGRRKGHDVYKNSAKTRWLYGPVALCASAVRPGKPVPGGSSFIFPLGAEANELMALIYLQALDGRAAIRSYDAVASQNLPVSFYVEIRGRHNLDRPAKCELSRDQIRLIYLASYDKKGFPKPPAHQVARTA